MFPVRKRRYLFRKPPLAPRLVLVILALLAGAAVVFLLPRPSATVSARVEGQGAERALVLEVEGAGGARRFDVPSLAIARPLDAGRARIRVPTATLPAEGGNLAYVVRGPWYAPDGEGEIALAAPGSEVDYVVRVKPDGAGGAWLTVRGDRDNHLLLFDPSGKVALSGRQSDLAGPDGAVRVRFSAPEMNEAQRDDGPTTARLSVTNRAGAVSDDEIVLRETPSATVRAEVLFPPPGTATRESVVRVRMITEPGATVRFGDAPAGLNGPRVEYDWPIPRPGKHSLPYEVRSPGLKTLRGRLEVERVGEGAEESPAGGGAAALSVGELERRAGALTGKQVELAGVVLARPTPAGSLELVEIGSGDGGGLEVAVVFSPNAFPPLRAGDPVIVRGRMLGTQRLRTAAGRLVDVPKIHANELLIRSQAESGSLFDSRYAALIASFWREPAEERAAPALAPPTVRVLASREPWPDPLAPQARQPVLASEKISGRGDRLPPERLARPLPPASAPEPAAAAPPEQVEAPATAKAPAPAQVEAPAPAQVEAPAPATAKPPAPEPAEASTPEAPAPAQVEAPAPATAKPPAPEPAEASTPEAPAPAQEETLAPSVRVKRGGEPQLPGVGRVPGLAAPAPRKPPIAGVPGAVAPPPGTGGDGTRPPDWAWTRDRALESELVGRGVSGVRILRRGRSIRLRGSVSDDYELRALYQFMSDKGFGEVDYGVEVR